MRRTIELSEAIRGVLSNLVEELKPQEAVLSIGLFGSRSRGDDVPQSDIDLLIVDKRDFDDEYIERIEFNNLLVDLNYIPQKWLVGRIPPEIDQKIFEADILYDREAKLTRTKNLMVKTYWTPERVDLRTESYLLESYTYLSRATSAQNKGDLESATVYATIGLEEILKTLIEVNILPLSNSHFIEALESSAKELDMHEVFQSYLDISRLSELDRFEVENRLSYLEAGWTDAMASVKTLGPVPETLHPKVRRNLNYYGKPIFLKGLVPRCRAMIEEGSFVEAGHYLNRPFLNMLENYAWLALIAAGSRYDYTALFDSLRSIDSTRRIYESAVKSFRIEDLTPRKVEASLKKTKEMISDLRQRRKDLIKKYVTSSVK